MTRKEARKAAEVMLAYADGKEIEYIGGDEWHGSADPVFNWDNKLRYRVKPQHRPFKNWIEYLAESKYHKPYDTVCYSKTICLIIAHTDTMIRTYDTWYSFEEAFKQLTFADGTPFGILIKENE